MRLATTEIPGCSYGRHYSLLAFPFGLAWFVFQLHSVSHPTIKLEPNRQSMAFCSTHIPVGVLQWLTGDQRQKKDTPAELQKYLLGTYA
jgi:hypothetical protein